MIKVLTLLALLCLVVVCFGDSKVTQESIPSDGHDQVPPSPSVLLRSSLFCFLYTLVHRPPLQGGHSTSFPSLALLFSPTLLKCSSFSYS